MAINRLAGLVLPSSTKYLIDNVIGKHPDQLLVADSTGGNWRDGSAGIVFVYVDTTAVEVGATDDLRFAEASAGAHRKIARKVLRCQQNGSTGFADHE